MSYGGHMVCGHSGSGTYVYAEQTDFHNHEYVYHSYRKKLGTIMDTEYRKFDNVDDAVKFFKHEI
jgi:hypothetical protein